MAKMIALGQSYFGLEHGKFLALNLLQDQFHSDDDLRFPKIPLPVNRQHVFFHQPLKP